MTIIDYTATGAVALKNWEIMMRPSSDKLPYDENTEFCLIFVDHATQLVFMTFQLSAGAEETVESKHHFEAFAASHEIKVRKYRADNGVNITRFYSRYFTF